MSARHVRRITWHHYAVFAIGLLSVLLVGTPIAQWQKLLALAACALAVCVVALHANLRGGRR